MAQFVSKRAQAARRNGSIGGLKTAQTHSSEFLEERAAKAGTSTRDRYGIGYYSFLAVQGRKVFKNKTSKRYSQEVIKSILPHSNKSTTSTDLMQAATATLEV